MTAVDIGPELAAIRARVVEMQTCAAITRHAIRGLVKMVSDVADAHQDQMQVLRTILDDLDRLDPANASQPNAQ